MMMPHMMPMMGGMPMVLPPQDQGSSSDEADHFEEKEGAEPSGAASSDVPVTDPEGPGYHRGKKYCKTIDAVITRSASSIKSLGKCRLGQAVEWLQECLDATMVADLSRCSNLLPS